MNAQELRVGNIISDHFGNAFRVVSPNDLGNDIKAESSRCGTFYASFDFWEPIPITESILANNGWILKSGIWVYKGPVRLGWKDGKLYVGYAEWPKPIRFVHELQNVMYDAGLEEESIKFKI